MYRLPLFFCLLLMACSSPSPKEKKVELKATILPEKQKIKEVVADKKDSATVSFVNPSNVPFKYQLQLNGQNLEVGETYRIACSAIWDSIIITNYRPDLERDTTLLKLRADSSYRVRVNPCSFYDVQPSKGGGKGVVRYFYKDKSRGKITAKLDHGDRQISKNRWSSYYSFEPSAMCFSTRKAMGFEEQEQDYIYVHFLHQEKFSYHYDVAKQQAVLHLDGYLRKGEKYSDIWSE